MIWHKDYEENKQVEEKPEPLPLIPPVQVDPPDDQRPL